MIDKADVTAGIYLAAHRKYTMYDDDIYHPLQVGAAIDEDLHLPYIDNIGDNISAKNRHYCELTAFYWLWKNCTKDIVGVGHYRRIPVDQNNGKFTKDDLIEIFKDHDFITNGSLDLARPEKNYFELEKHGENDIPKDSTYNQYRRTHKIVDMDLAWYYIQEHCSEYEEDFVNQIVFGKLFIPCNILIASKDIFDGFCEWLFNILFFVEKYSPYKTYDNYNQRVFGFLAERLFALYFYHNNLKCYSCNTIDLEEGQHDEE